LGRRKFVEIETT